MEIEGKCLWHLTQAGTSEKAPQCNTKASRNVSSMLDLTTVELCDTHYKCVIAWVDE